MQDKDPERSSGASAEGNSGVSSTPPLIGRPPTISKDAKQMDDAAHTGSEGGGLQPPGVSVSNGKASKKDKKARKAATSLPEAAAQAPLGTSKAVETMFRNAVRAELDIIALAATKANIMISLNGFIISALMISGAFLFNSSPVFLVPAGVFMLTSAASIVFALLAASPERVGTARAVWDWMTALRHRRAKPRDLRGYLERTRTAPDSPDFNLLIYEDRSRLSRAENWERMQELLRDRDEIYRKMSDHLYWLGRMASHKFKLLDVSYTVFRWGLLASVLTFFLVRSTQGLWANSETAGAVSLRNLGIAEFNDIYEPSAVQQLPDGTILVVEDEAKRAVSLLSIGSDGTLVEDSVADLRMMRGLGRRLSDLEGLTIDDGGAVYAITSHSMTNDNERSPDREHLLRFRVQAGSAGDVQGYTGLRDALAADAELASAIRSVSGRDAEFDDLNIEGLAWHEKSRRLLLGLRAPLAGDRSLIIPIENPDDLLNDGAAPRFGPPVLLDLSGGGIRALSYDPVLDAFLIVNEIEGHEGNRYSQMWMWSGDPVDPAEPIALPDIINLNNVESVDSILIDGQPRLLIMSDEGNPKKDRPAKYMILDYGQLGT